MENGNRKQRYVNLTLISICVLFPSGINTQMWDVSKNRLVYWQQMASDFWFELGCQSKASFWFIWWRCCIGSLDPFFNGLNWLLKLNWDLASCVKIILARTAVLYCSTFTQLFRPSKTLLCAYPIASQEGSFTGQLRKSFLHCTLELNSPMGTAKRPPSYCCLLYPGKIAISYSMAKCGKHCGTFTIYQTRCKGGLVRYPVYLVPS